MDKQRQDDQLEPLYNSFVQIQDVAFKTYRERWTIETGGERESGISVLAVRHDDDDDDDDNSVGVKKAQIVQVANSTNWYLGKKFSKKKREDE